MNPLTNVKNVIKLSEQELRSGNKTSWHDQYRSSAWLFIGGLPYDLSEGDLICVFSQYGEIVNVNLIRDKKTGKQKGFGFLCYEDQRSTNLAVDNLNGIKLLGKTVRVDHVSNYKPPKDNENYDDITRKLHSEGCAPVSQIPERNIKQEDSRSRKRSPALIISPVVKRIKRESPERDSHRGRSDKRMKKKSHKRDGSEKKSKKSSGSRSKKKKSKRSSSSSSSSSEIVTKKELRKKK
ncbi:unnamed protein product [Diamesa hyperborea]